MNPLSAGLGVVAGLAVTSALTLAPAASAQRYSRSIGNEALRVIGMKGLVYLLCDTQTP